MRAKLISKCPRAALCSDLLLFTDARGRTIKWCEKTVMSGYGGSSLERFFTAPRVQRGFSVQFSS